MRGSLLHATQKHTLFSFSFEKQKQKQKSNALTIQAQSSLSELEDMYRSVVDGFWDFLWRY